jgi:hypothetical protein
MDANEYAGGGIGRSRLPSDGNDIFEFEIILSCEY